MADNKKRLDESTDETIKSDTSASDNTQSSKDEQSNWYGKGQDAHTDDPLLGCLLILTKLHNKPYSARAVTSGLPLSENKLTPDTFARAAERAELSAQIVKRSLNEIDKRFFPAVLLLANKQACIILSHNDENAQIIQPETGEGASEISLEELGELYTGFAIFTAPTYKFSKRSEEHAPVRERNWFWAVIGQSWSTYSEVLVASFLINVFALASPLFIMNVYDRVVPNHALATLWVLAIGVFIVFSFDLLMRLLRNHFIDRAAHRIDSKLSASIFEQLIGLKMESRPGSVGVLANNVTAFESFREFITSATVTILVDLPFVLLFIAVIWMLSGSLAIVPMIAIPLMLIAALIIQFPLNEMIKRSYRFSAEKQATLYEALSGAETIKTTGSESHIQKRWERAAVASSKIGTQSRQLSVSAITFSMYVQNISVVAIVIMGVYLISTGELTVGALIAVTILTGRSLAPMSQLAGLIVRYQQTKTALNAVDMLMQAPVERPRGKTMLRRPVLAGNIEFKNVSFNYPEQEVTSIDNVSFTIKEGEKVGLIGRIGSGKTTLEKLLLGLYQPTSGTIIVDGTEIQQLDPAELRHNIGYVPQDVILFYGSVKDNIVLGAPYTSDADIIRSIQIAGVDRFVNQHPHGFDLQVGERGSQLSGGQRQSIAIARALLVDPPILAMDEPTNSMDDRSETHFKTALAEYAQGKTLLLSTHKGSMLSIVDRLIVLENGRMVANGPKDKVLQALSEGKIKVS